MKETVVKLAGKNRTLFCSTITEAAFILGLERMLYHYHRKIDLASKCKIGTDFKLQLLILIYTAMLSNVHPVLPFKLLKDVCIER